MALTPFFDGATHLHVPPYLVMAAAGNEKARGLAYCGQVVTVRQRLFGSVFKLTDIVILDDPSQRAVGMWATRLRYPSCPQQTGDRFHAEGSGTAARIAAQQRKIPRSLQVVWWVQPSHVFLFEKSLKPTNSGPGVSVLY